MKIRLRLQTTIWFCFSFVHKELKVLYFRRHSCALARAMWSVPKRGAAVFAGRATAQTTECSVCRMQAWSRINATTENLNCCSQGWALRAAFKGVFFPLY